MAGRSDNPRAIQWMDEAKTARISSTLAATLPNLCMALHVGQFHHSRSHEKRGGILDMEYRNYTIRPRCHLPRRPHQQYKMRKLYTSLKFERTAIVGASPKTVGSCVLRLVYDEPSRRHSMAVFFFFFLTDD